MREMGNWREHQIERLANDRAAAIDYLQLTLEEYLVDGDLPFISQYLPLSIRKWKLYLLSKRPVLEMIF